MKARSPGRLAIKHLSHHKSRLATATLWRVLFILAPMQVPILSGAIVDGLTHKQATLYGIDLPSSTPRQVLLVGTLGLLAIAAVHGFCSYYQQIASGRLCRQFVLSLRKQLVEKVTALSLDLHQRYGCGDLIERVMGDTATMREFVNRVFIQSLTNLVRIGYPLVMMFLIDALMALVATAILLPQLVLSRYLQLRLHAATHRSRASQSNLTSAVKESFDGIETLKTLGAEDGSIDRIFSAAEHLEGDELRAHRYAALINGNVWMMTSLGIAITWWLGGTRVLSGDMTLGTLVVFTGFVAFLYQPFRQFTAIATIYRSGLVSLERIQDLLDMPSSVVERPDARPLKLREGKIEFADVEFGYGSTPVLKHFDLTLGPRQYTAIVGRSGSGKSSLLRLIVRLYDPQRGAVRIDDQPLAGTTVDSLRGRIAVVPQHPVLFTGTLWENIVLARPEATAAEVRAVCEQAGAWAFIEKLPDGLQTRVGRAGENLSGGQTQRLAIARALLCDPKILLLDEPTSALDAESESLLVETLCALRRQMTVVVVAHRRETICHADRIVLMDAGRVIADGPHQHLLAESELYQELFPHPAFGPRSPGRPAGYYDTKSGSLNRDPQGSAF